MIDNLNGLAALFKRMWITGPHARLPAVAERLVSADMGAAAAQRHMSEAYHATVNEAKRLLRDQEDHPRATNFLFVPAGCPIGV